MPHDDDCERPACSDTISAMQSIMSRMPKKPEVRKSVACPPGTNVIGRGSWTLLHSMTAWYPNEPSQEDRVMMKNFFESLGRFFPCTYCAQDFQAEMKVSPVPTSSRKELCQWLCQQHNLVNEKLGKSSFPCDIKSLDERWRKSTDVRCNKGIADSENQR